jgi:hypothetical protein
VKLIAEAHLYWRTRFVQVGGGLAVSPFCAFYCDAQLHPNATTAQRVQFTVQCLWDASCQQSPLMVQSCCTGAAQR